MKLFTIWKMHGFDSVEMISAWDEYTVDENHDGWESQIKHQKSLHGEVRVVVVNVPGLDDCVLDAFDHAKIEATSAKAAEEEAP